NCDANCENCDVRIDAKNRYCRCGNVPTTVCGAPEVQDTCGAGDVCHCMFGPPLALNSGGTPVCVVNRFAQEFTGGTSVVGSYDVGTRTKALVYTGIGQLNPCPTCNGDANPNSQDSAGGTCSGGPRNGL